MKLDPLKTIRELAKGRSCREMAKEIGVHERVLDKYLKYGTKAKFYKPTLRKLNVYIAKMILKQKRNKGNPGTPMVPPMEPDCDIEFAEVDLDRRNA